MYRQWGRQMISDWVQACALSLSFSRSIWAERGLHLNDSFSSWYSKQKSHRGENGEWKYTKRGISLNRLHFVLVFLKLTLHDNNFERYRQFYCRSISQILVNRNVCNNNLRIVSITSRTALEIKRERYNREKNLNNFLNIIPTN